MNGTLRATVAFSSMAALAGAAPPARDFSAYARPVPAHVMADLPFAMTAPLPPVFRGPRLQHRRLRGRARRRDAQHEGVRSGDRRLRQGRGRARHRASRGVAHRADRARERGRPAPRPRGARLVQPALRGLPGRPALPRLARAPRDVPDHRPRQEGLAITGKGVFDGSGDAWVFAKKDKLRPGRVAAAPRPGRRRLGGREPSGGPRARPLEGAALVAALRERHSRDGCRLRRGARVPARRHGEHLRQPRHPDRRPDVPQLAALHDPPGRSREPDHPRRGRAQPLEHPERRRDRHRALPQRRRLRHPGGHRRRRHLHEAGAAPRAHGVDGRLRERGRSRTRPSSARTAASSSGPRPRAGCAT